jgi:hypothetical protein
MSQIRNLLRRLILQPIIPLPLITQSILAPIPEDAEARKTEHRDLHAEIDGVADVVFWCVVDEVGPSETRQLVDQCTK